MLYFILFLSAAFSVFCLLRSGMKLLEACIWSVLFVFCGVFSVKLFAVMEGNTWVNMSLFGSLFLLPLFYLVVRLFYQAPWGAVADAFASALAFTLCAVRFNCLDSGCCEGSVVPALLAGDAVYFWPVRELEIIFWSTLCGVLLSSKGRYSPGRLYAFLMMDYGSFRFLVQFLRTDFRFSLSHFWAVLCFAVGLFFWMALKGGKPYSPRDYFSVRKV